MRILSTLFLIFTIAACDKKAETSLGPQVTPEEIKKAESEALKGADPLKIQQGEFAYYLKTQEVFSSQEPSSLLMEEEARTVTERTDHPDYVSITVVREVIDHLTEGSPHFKFEDVFGIPKVPTEEPPPPVEPPSTEEPAVTVTFHNLRISKEKIEKPTKVLEREPCPEGADCRLNATIIHYDAVVNEAGQEQRKFMQETWISTEVPYFSTILKSCITTVIAVDDLRPAIRQCKSVYDYRFQ